MKTSEAVTPRTASPRSPDGHLVLLFIDLLPRIPGFTFQRPLDRPLANKSEEVIIKNTANRGPWAISCLGKQFCEWTPNKEVDVRS